MFADAVRHLFDYNFAENRTAWEAAAHLSDDDFAREAAYSHGSVRNQVMHLVDVDEAWFSDLGAVSMPDVADPDALDRAAIRERWDELERQQRAWLADLTDEALAQKPIAEGEDKDLLLWQILLHVANHGTDHRAQLLRLLNDLGVKTTSQDYIFYVYDHPAR
jgi:uncharacterized damage-inducible protein DinB